MKNGKAENLGILSSLRGINVPRFVVLCPGLSKVKKAEVIRQFLKDSQVDSMAVRSSSGQEDSSDASFAGMYSTKLRVQTTQDAIQAAVEEVCSSGMEKEKVISHYAKLRGVEVIDSGISVIIQEMIEADTSGVILSHGLVEDDGYYVISVSNGVGEAIVSGATNGKLIRIARKIEVMDIKEVWLRQLIEAMRIIEQQFCSSSLDVEFAFKNDNLYILQCRPITTTSKGLSDEQESKLLEQIELVNASVVSNFSEDILGDMIDINPAELLGLAPTPLDISIFRYLFADKVVERVRQAMGYDPLNVGLLKIVAGKPYVSMRASAFSFRPLGISDNIYEQMVKVYRNEIRENTALQSSVEFDVYAMSSGEKLEQVMQEARLNTNEKFIVREAFLHIDTVLAEVSITQTKDFATFSTTYAQQTESMDNASLEEILKHVANGTEMFVRVARLAFYWKNRFEELYPQIDLNNLIGGHIHSVSGELQSDLVACREGILTKEEIVKRYGHLRPGQFSVFGESYMDDPDTYLFVQMEEARVINLEQTVSELAGTIEFKHVVTFMQAREQMKFLFSQSLHLFITKLRDEIFKREISRDNASCLTWDELNACINGSVPVKGNYSRSEPSIILPEVIIPGLSDLKVIMFSETMPRISLTQL